VGSIGALSPRYYKPVTPFTTELQQMGNDPKLVTAKSIDEYFENYATNFDYEQRLKVTAAVMELFRMTGGFAEKSGDYPTTVRAGLVELMAQLCEMPWEKVPFSMTFAAFKNQGAPIDIFEGLKSFATVVETEPASASREVFDALLEPAIDIPLPAAPPPPPPAPPVKKSPELVHAGTVSRVFQPAKFTPDGGPKVELLNWQSELINGKLGPQLVAVSLSDGDEPRLLLETGEFKTIPMDTFLLAKTTEAQDYATVPVYLMACLRAYAPWNWLSEPKFADESLDARFGKFTKPVHYCPYSSALIAPLMQIFDFPQASPEGHCVSVRLSVDGTPYFVTLDARVSQNGPYVTAKLVDSSENVVMRLDTPRLFSPLGVYLFPLQDSVIALILH
jgi:hypothetical protein